METTTVNTYLSLNGDTFTAVAIIGPEKTVFAGVATTSSFTTTFVQTDNRLTDLLITAVNNRTRERNYFRKYCELLEGQLSDEAFDKEIEENRDEYVVSLGKEADLTDINLALKISPYLKDVQDPDDMATLFSFSRKSMQKSIEQK